MATLETVAAETARRNVRSRGERKFQLEREPGDERAGVFTSGIVSTGQGQKIALYFTGRQHAGENIADVLKQRAKDLSPVIQMCDAANCLAHGRRQFVEVVQNFREEFRHVLEMLGEVHRYDAEAREGGLTAEERLRFHQEHSGLAEKDRLRPRE